MLFAVPFSTILLFTLSCSSVRSARSNENDLSRAQYLLSQGNNHKAKMILENLCQENYGPGCAILGGLNHKEKIPGYAELYQKACDLKDGLGCYGVASIHYRAHDGDAFKKNIAFRAHAT